MVESSPQRSHHGLRHLDNMSVDVCEYQFVTDLELILFAEQVPTACEMAHSLCGGSCDDGLNDCMR